MILVPDIPLIYNTYIYYAAEICYMSFDVVNSITSCLFFTGYVLCFKYNIMSCQYVLDLDRCTLHIVMICMLLLFVCCH